jgi:hypothetical protein
MTPRVEPKTVPSKADDTKQSSALPTTKSVKGGKSNDDAHGRSKAGTDTVSA